LTTKFIKYTLIVILAVSLYFVWFQKQKLDHKNLQLTKKIEKQKQKISSLKQTISVLKQELNKKQKIKKIKLVLPKIENDFHYSCDTNLSDFDIIKFKQKRKKKKDNSTQIEPMILLDQSEKKIDGFKINLKTKF